MRDSDKITRSGLELGRKNKKWFETGKKNTEDRVEGCCGDLKMTGQEEIMAKDHQRPL